MITVAVSLIPLAIWAYLLFGRGWFWLCGERDDTAAAANKVRNEADAWPSVVAIIPARDEADMIARSVGSLLRQDYPGPFSVVVVDDQSTDGTAAVASTAASDGPCSRAAKNRYGKRAAARLDRQTVSDAPGLGRGRSERAGA